jgi:predicted secreted protein
MASISGKNGAVYIATTLIDDCQDDWEDGTHGTAALSTDSKVGDYSVAITGSSVVAGDVLAYEAIAAGATNYSTFTHVLCWAKYTGTTSVADLRLCLDSGAGAPAAPETLLDFPALTANVWQYCHLTEVTGSTLDDSTAAVTVGLEWNANAQDKILYLTDIRAAKNIAGINSWDINYVCDALETTDFASAGARSYIAGCTGWSGSFSGYKDGAPLSIGSQYGGEFAESATTTQMWKGTIIITAVHPTINFDGVVEYSYDFQGSGDLTIAST